MSDNPHLLRRGALLPDGSVVVQLYVDSSSQITSPNATKET